MALDEDVVVPDDDVLVLDEDVVVLLDDVVALLEGTAVLTEDPLEILDAWEALTLSLISRAFAALVCPELKLSLAGMSALRTENDLSGWETP